MSTTILRTSFERQFSRPGRVAVPAPVEHSFPNRRAATLALSLILALPSVAGALAGMYSPAEEMREARQRVLIERARAASAGLEAELGIGLLFAAARVAIDGPPMQGGGR